MFNLVLLLVQLPRPKEVINGLVILYRTISATNNVPECDWTYDLQKLALHFVLPTFLPHHLRDLEYLFHGTRNHTLGRLRNPTFHSERFAGASLTVRKNADVVPVNTALSELRDVFKNFRLGRAWFKDLGQLISNGESK